MPTIHRTIKVIQIDNKGNVTIGMQDDNKIEYIVGQEALLQKIVLRIFTSRGSNSFENEYFGSDIYNLIGRGFVPGQEEILKAGFLSVFDQIEQQIKLEQSQDQSLLAEERLDKLIVNSVDYDPSSLGWYIKVTVITAAGGRAKFNLVIGG